jgi:predicted nucleic acid-binding protein
MFGKTRPMPEVVFDSCVLSNFSLAGVLPILESLYNGSAFVTDFVAAEVIRGIQKGHAGLTPIRTALREGFLKETALKSRAEKDLFERLSVSLGLGEASSIAAAKTRRWVFASDDVLARREAATLGIPLTGTIGILVKATHRKLLTIKGADAALSAMIEAGFYAPVDSIRSLA